MTTVRRSLWITSAKNSPKFINNRNWPDIWVCRRSGSQELDHGRFGASPHEEMLNDKDK